MKGVRGAKGMTRGGAEQEVHHVLLLASVPSLVEKGLGEAHA